MKFQLNHIIIVLLLIICGQLALMAWSLHQKRQFASLSDAPSQNSKAENRQGTVGQHGRKTGDKKNTAPVFYLDSAFGNDSSSGTSATTPWKSLSRLKRAAVKPGTRILLKRGAEWNTPLILPAGGTEERPVSVDAYGHGDAPLINLRGQFPKGIAIYHSNVHVSNLRIENAKNTGVGMSGKDGIRNVRLNGLSIYNSGSNGIGVSGGGSQIRIVNCRVENSDNNGIALLGSESNKLSQVVISGCHIKKTGSNDGITIHRAEGGLTPGAGFLIENTTAELCSEQGFDITSGKNILLLNNRSRLNKAGGILVGNCAEDVTIRGHISIDEPTQKSSAAINLNRDARNIRLIQSIVAGNGYHLLKVKASDVAVYNNTFVWNGGSSPWDMTGKTENIHFFNNIIYSSQKGMSRIRFLETQRPPDYKSFHLDHNLYFAAGEPVVFYFDNRNYPFETYRQDFRVEGASLSIDPEFVAPNSGNYRLKPTSPAIRSGRFLSSVPAGSSQIIRVDNALLFYKSPMPENRQKVWFTPGEKRSFSVTDVDYSGHTITLDQTVTLKTPGHLSLFPDGSGQTMGPYQYDGRNTQ